MSGLQVIWFWLIILLLTIYAVLDGFDLGAGFWYIFAKDDKERRSILNAIGPFWDGNEVWLLTGGGAIFAASPYVYATVFSGFYLAFIFVILALIFRAISIEFRNKSNSPVWKKIFDTTFVIGSILPPILYGVAVGNLIRGIELDKDGNFTGHFIDLLNPFAISIGLFSLVLFVAHSGNYLSLRIKDLKIRDRLVRLAIKGNAALLIVFIILVTILLTMASDIHKLWVTSSITFVLIFLAFESSRRRKLFLSFIFTSATIIGSMVSLGILLFPIIVLAKNNIFLSLAVANASSSSLTLKTMLIMALIGMPFVIGYTIWFYNTFKGKVTEEEYY